MPRFRLRFLLQEFDLTPGETILGRSPDCHITIDDPLMSRQHARIQVSAGGAILADLGSRNGSRVNGRLIVGPTELADGDRIRLGTQELVFFRVRTDLRAARATGAMRLCKHCTTPFPEGPKTCPHCGREVRDDEDTMSGVSGMPVQRVWILQMLNDMLDRVVRGGRSAEADKLLLRAAEETETRLAAEDIDAAQFDRVAELAIQCAVQQQSPRWALWAVALHRRAGRALPSAAVDALHTAAGLEGVRDSLAEYVQTRRASGGDDEGLRRLERLAAGDGTRA